MQLKSHVARQHLHTAGQRRVQNLHAGFQRLVKPLFLHPQRFGDALFFAAQLGVGLAHQPHQVGHQLVEKRGLLTEFVAVADGAAHDAALHIAAPFVAGQHAVADQKRRGADVVGDHFERVVLQIGAASFAGGGFNQLVKDVDLVVAVHVLQDGGDALQAHAGVHAGRGQFVQAAVGLHVELHEHMVPDFDEAVAVFVRAAGRATGNVGAVVVKNFGTRAAGAGVGHHPEVVGGVFFALVVADAHDAVCGQADFFVPDVIGLVVINVDGDHQALGRQFVDLGQQLPAPLQAFALEIVAKAPVPQHFEKRVVAGGVAHVFQVVVLAASAQTGLYRGGAHIGALVGTQKHVLELHHARVGEH